MIQRRAARGIFRMSRRAALTLLVLLPFCTAGADAAEQRLVLALPGIPPVFLAVLPYVADHEGFFRKYGLAVELKPFDTGANAARAVLAGQIDAAMATTPIVVAMDSNVDANLVGIYGLESPDWLIGSIDPKVAGCADLRDAAVGVDAPAGSRAIALRQMMEVCHLTLADVTLVGLSSNVGAAMIAGQLKVGVLHLDDLATIERERGSPLTIVMRFQDARPLDHINMVVTRADKLKTNRDVYVRLLAALIDANRFLRDPKNLDEVAEIATVTGRSVADIKAALPGFIALDYWPGNSAGLSRDHLEAVIKSQVEVGAIKPGVAPVPYEKLVDPSLWKDAMTMAGSH
jgi:NitT/TauT family transport system substrate-binding protein